MKIYKLKPKKTLTLEEITFILGDLKLWVKEENATAEVKDNENWSLEEQIV